MLTILNHLCVWWFVTRPDDVDENTQAFWWSEAVLLSVLAFLYILAQAIKGHHVMAGALLATVHRGYDLNWLDEFPVKVNALTTAHVNAAIKKYLKPDSLFIIKAGTIPGAMPAPEPT